MHAMKAYFKTNWRWVDSLTSLPHKPRPAATGTRGTGWIQEQARELWGQKKISIHEGILTLDRPAHSLVTVLVDYTC